MWSLTISHFVYIWYLNALSDFETNPNNCQLSTETMKEGALRNQPISVSDCNWWRTFAVMRVLITASDVKGQKERQRMLARLRTLAFEVWIWAQNLKSQEKTEQSYYPSTVTIQSWFQSDKFVCQECHVLPILHVRSVHHHRSSANGKCAPRSQLCHG